MRRLAGISLALALAATGCHRSPPTARSAPAQPTAPSPAPETPAAGPYVLTADKLDRFLKYQREMVAVYGKLLQDLDRLEKRADAGAYAGKLGGLAAIHDSLGLVEVQQQAEEQARRSAGLSEADVHAIQPMVGAVVAQRKYASLVNLDQSIAQLQKMREQLPADQRAQIDQSLAALQKQKADADGLADERQKFGDANVTLLLTREKDLLSNYDAWIAAMGKR